MSFGILHIWPAIHDFLARYPESSSTWTTVMSMLVIGKRGLSRLIRGVLQKATALADCAYISVP
jgi:hypothetical protein